MPATDKFTPNPDRIGLVTATVLLALALTRIVPAPEFNFELQLPGFLLAFPFNGNTLMGLLTACLAAAGMDWLLRGHPSIRARNTFQWWFLPTLSTFVISVLLSVLPGGQAWWVGFLISGTFLYLVFLAEYISVDPNAPFYTVAMAGITAISYTLFFILSVALRTSEVRLFLIAPALFLAECEALEATDEIGRKIAAIQGDTSGAVTATDARAASSRAGSRPGGRRAPSRGTCGRGCAGAFELIKGLGLGRYYERRAQAGITKGLQPEEAPVAADPSAWVATDAKGVCRRSLMVEGLQCGACVWLIEQSLLREAGVEQARVSLSTRRLTLAWRDGEADPVKLIDRIQRLGYRLVPFDPRLLQSTDDAESKALLRAMVRSEEFWSAESRWMLIKSPVHLAAGACRQLEIEALPLAEIGRWLAATGQTLFDTPNNGEGGWPGQEAWVSPPERLAIRADGGYLCIVDLEEEDGSFHRSDSSFDGHHGFGAAALEELLHAAGFRAVRFEQVHEIKKEGGTYPLFLATAMVGPG